jgi:hypothetical protein
MVFIVLNKLLNKELNKKLNNIINRDKLIVSENCDSNSNYESTDRLFVIIKVLNILLKNDLRFKSIRYKYIK